MTLSGHELGPFDGLVISTSGHNAAEKDRLGKLILQGGGIYSKNMTKACTHLVINKSDGPRSISEKERCEFCDWHFNKSTICSHWACSETKSPDMLQT